VRYLSHSGGQGLLLERDAAIPLLRTIVGNKKSPGQRVGRQVKIRFAGASSEAELEPLDEQEGEANTSWAIGLRGGTRTELFARWNTAVLCIQASIWFYGNRNHLEHDFIVAPGADYRRIGLESPRRIRSVRQPAAAV